MFALTQTSLHRPRTSQDAPAEAPSSLRGVAPRPAIDESPAPAPRAAPPPDVPSVARSALKQLDAGGIGATVHNATALLERAADAASGPLPKRVAMLRAALKQLAPTTAAQLAAHVPAGASPLEAKLHAGGLELAHEIGLAQKAGAKAIAPTERELTVLTELLGANPHSAVEVLGLVASTPSAGATLARLAEMYPPSTEKAQAASRAALSADLAAGDVEQKTVALLRDRRVPEQDIASFMRAFAEVRSGFERGARAGDDMQRTNWVHTRIEIMHTLEVAKALGLSADETMMAALGSLASDAFKDATQHSLLTHNRAGAELVLPLVMGRTFDLGDARNQRLLAGAMRVAHEHQITPPLFMSGAMKGLLAGAPEAVVNEVFQHTNAPLAAPAVGGEVVFSAAAQAVLAEKGVPGWAVPTPGSAHHGASIAAMAGDVWQYVSPDGILKIAVDIRDPEQKAPFMRDALLKDAIGSSLEFSFGQGMSVIADAGVKAAMDGEKTKMKAMLEGDRGVYARVEGELRRSLGVRDGAPLPEVPYWNAKVATDRALTPDERRSVDLVKSTFQRVLAEAGAVPLDPFGTVKG